MAKEDRAREEKRIAKEKLSAKKRIKEWIIETSICREEIEMPVVTKRKALNYEGWVTEWAGTDHTSSVYPEPRPNLWTDAAAYRPTRRPRAAAHLCEQNWARSGEQKSDSNDSGGKDEK